MSHQRGPDRRQTQLLPPSVEEYVEANAPVRFLDVFVEELDFQNLGFLHAQPDTTGRRPYHPADLLKLYVYGYLNRVRSSRRLEAEAARNLEVIWLLRGLRPDFKTIADFRKANRACLAPVLKQFNLLCRQLDLFGAELVAIDGSKFKAVNSVGRSFTQEQLQELLPRIEARIQEYLALLDSQDQAAEGAASRPSREELQDKIERLKSRRDRDKQLLQEMVATGQREVSLTDPESRRMKRVKVGYNVQVAVDAKHHLIVASEVVNAANDLGQLSTMAQAAQAMLAVKTLQVVADAGYHATSQLAVCQQNGIETYVPDKGHTSGQSSNGQKVYPKEAFQYDAQTDAYRCPGGQSLTRSRTTQRRGQTLHHYDNRAACRQCSLRTQCTVSSYRKIERQEHEAVAQAQAARVGAHPEIVARRKAIVEHVFGTLRQWHHDNFLLKGLEKVRAEFSLSALAYNLRRVLNLKPVTVWLEKLKKLKALPAAG